MGAESVSSQLVDLTVAHRTLPFPDTHNWGHISGFILLVFYCQQARHSCQAVTEEDRETIKSAISYS